MNSRCQLSPVDHHLVARVQACITGANAHRLHVLLGNYFELCFHRNEDQAMTMRVEKIERELRALCLIARSATLYPLDPHEN